MKHKLFIISFFVLNSVFNGFGQFIYPPDLQCVENDNSNGNITLYWTDPNNSCGPFVQYTLYASSTGPGGPYTVVIPITPQTATSFTCINFLGTAPIWYFYMESNFNCPGFTVLQSDTVNNLNPTTPQIVNVDVTTGGDVIFNWLPSPSPQTQYYIIYYYLPNGNAVPIDTVFGRFTTTFTDTAGDPTTQSLVYTIAAHDSCTGVSAFNTSPHNTIYATASVTACQRQVNLAWNRYINWVPGVQQYQIWVSRNDSAFVLDGTTDTATLVYSYTNFNDGDTLCIFIRATSAADTTILSRSNMICMRASIVQPPSYNYITNVTVDRLTNRVSITWVIDTSAFLIYYKVERSANNTTYDAINQFSVPVPLLHFQTFKDSFNVLPQNNPYYYQIVAFDSCQTTYASPYGKTVCLKGELFDYYIANVNWNDFELQGATILRYNLYRDYGSGYQLIQTFPFGINSFSDSLQQFLHEKGTFCYYIEAVYYLNLPSIYQDTLSSFSNEICVIHRPIIYIPNAFAPNGVNNIFKPFMIFSDPHGYDMTIYNRWGGKVFETEDPNAGWDGTDHGKESPQGGYAYLIRFTADDGVVVERKGVVLLIK